MMVCMMSGSAPGSAPQAMPQNFNDLCHRHGGAGAYKTKKKNQRTRPDDKTDPQQFFVDGQHIKGCWGFTG
jgi:hypothetical protein